MRKSSRTRKSVELYKPAPFTTIREHPWESADESDKEDDVDEVPDEVFAQKPRKAPTKKKATSKTKHVSNGGQSSIYDAVYANKNIDEKASEWLTFFHNNRVGATAELFNFIFMCCGAQKNWLQPTTDLETLDGGELEELLSEMMKAMVASKAHVHYPLQTKKGLRDHYVSFFTSVVATQHRLHNSLSSLTPVIDTLIALSSTALNNIRDAATEASLVTLSQCVVLISDLTERNALLQRQLDPMQKAKQTTTAKYKHLAKDVDDNKTLTAALSTLANNLFNGIFVHRYKDTLEVIRWRAICHLGQWIVTHRETYMTEEYLKYVGWMLSDPDTDTRLESVETIKSIVETPNATHRLQRFIDRFMDRMIEIAACDSYAPCSVTMLQAFRTMQRVGLLDTLRQEKLDQLDIVVFDLSSSAEARREALALMMDHTEGFEMPTHGKSSGRKSDAAAYAERQLHSTQCEMLLEFCEYHLQDANPELGKLLAEACLSLPQSGILTDWSMICSLLLREAEPLTSFRITVLLHMLLFTAEFLHDEEAHASKSKNNTISREWQALQETIFSNLPKLVHRYRDNVTNLELLLQLYRYYEHRNIPADFFKSIMEVYDVTTEDSCLQIISGLLRSWHDASGSNIVTKHIESLLAKHWGQIQTCFESIGSFAQREHQNLSKKSKRSSKSGSMKVGDALHTLSTTMHRYSLLWRSLDCRDFHSENADVVASLLQSLEALLLEAAPHIPLVSGIEAALQKSIIHTGYALYHILLWNTRDIYLQVSKQEYGSELDISIDTVVKQRDSLTPLLERWMTFDDLPFHHDLALEGFRLSNDLRVLFPVRLQGVPEIQKLVWNPSRDMVAAMRKVFMEEGQRFGDEMADMEEDDRRDIAVQLVERLLAPLSRAIVTDVDNLNRRQAAAVLLYIMDDNVEAQQLIKSWIKRLKELNTIRYLEVQMVALKTHYQDQMIEHSDYNACIALAKRLVITMGVNKVKADLIPPVLNFFKAGIDFALESVDTIMFFGLLEVYLRLLPQGAFRELGEYLNEKLETTLKKEVADIIYGDTSDPTYTAYADFRYKVTGDRRHPTVHRRKYTAAPTNLSSAEKKTRTSETSNSSNQFWESGQGSTPTIVRAYGSKGAHPSATDSFRLSAPEISEEDQEDDAMESDEAADIYVSQKRKSFERKRKNVSLGLHLEEVEDTQASKRRSATPGSQGSAPSDLFADLDIRPSRKKYR